MLAACADPHHSFEFELSCFFPGVYYTRGLPSFVESGNSSVCSCSRKTSKHCCLEGMQNFPGTFSILWWTKGWIRCLMKARFRFHKAFLSLRDRLSGLGRLVDFGAGFWAYTLSRSFFSFSRMEKSSLEQFKCSLAGTFYLLRLSAIAW